MSQQQATNRFESLISNMIANPERVYRVLLYVAAVFLLVNALFPIYWLFVLALTPLSDINNLWLLPNGFNVAAFLEVFDTVPLHAYMVNSFIIGTITTVMVIAIGSLAGYVFGRLEFPGRRPLFLLFLVISYFPGTTFLIPLFRFFTGNVMLFGTPSPDLFATPYPPAFSLTAVLLPLSIFILTNFYSQIPDGLEDAARIEGCTRIGSLYRVIMPLSKPGVTTVAMLTFILAYNDFFFSFLLTSGSPSEGAPLVHGILRFIDLGVRPYNLMAAASLWGLVPVVILVLIGQQKIVSGLTSGGLKE